MTDTASGEEPGLEARPPVMPGEAASDFTLASVERDPVVPLADSRGRSPVLLALFVGFWRPFRHRAIAQMGTTRARLGALGAEVLGVVATPPRMASGARP